MEEMPGLIPDSSDAQTTDLEALELNRNGAPDTPSVIDAVKARRRELGESKTLTLAIPGYDGRLAVRYHTLSGEVFNRLVGARALRGGQIPEHVNADILIQACDAVLVEDGGTLKPIGDVAGIETAADDPVKFDSRLAEILELEADTAREVVHEVFSPKGRRDLTYPGHAAALVSWMQGNEEEIDQSLLDF